LEKVEDHDHCWKRRIIVGGLWSRRMVVILEEEKYSDC
jgi:hypothetical protein